MRPISGLFPFVFIFAGLILSGCDSGEPVSPVKSDQPPVMTQLTSNHEVFEANPIFSPDGAWVLFESDVTGNRDIWRIPATGGQAEQLTTDKGFDSAPFWSPDGTRIVFESDRTGFKKIWILDLSVPGSDPYPLTSGEWSDADPVWSPDGLHIAYESTRDKNWGSEIWLSPLDGGPATRLTSTDDGIYHRTADWSPDSAHLAFESNRAGESAIFTLPAQGGTAFQLTPNQGYEGHPAWSPDGLEILFESTATGTMEIFRVPAAGGESFQVSIGGGFWPRWAPDGNSIVFCVFGDPEPNIWVMEVDW